MNTATIAALTTPSIILSYSEAEFLLAEAALRDWESSASAEEHYHTQFYLAHYMYLDFFEAWSGWRRTGYPDFLTPINYVLNSTGSSTIRRLIYSYDKKALNKSNYEAAVANQRPDKYMTRVWWNKQ